MYQFLLAICGLPASGKTTLANALWNRSKDYLDVQLISTDMWRDEAFYSDFQPWKEQKVRERARIETQDFLLIGDSIVHDDTNYYASMRHELYEMARFVGCFFGVIHVTTPLEVALEWNRQRTSNIPDEVIERIDERFDLPGSKYAWDQPIFKFNPLTMNTTKAVDEIVEILGKAEPSYITERKKYQELKNDYDAVSRNVVATFLREYRDLRGDPMVSKIRKDVIEKAKSKSIPIDAMKEQLMSELMKLVI